MLVEILLLSVIAVTAWVTPMVLRRTPPGQRTYAWLLIADLALAIVAFAALRSTTADARMGALLAFIAIGAAVCLVVVPPILRDLARRAIVRDWLRAAAWLTDARELLQPGMGARQERELIDAIIAVRSGRVDEAVEVLRETRAQLDQPLARRQIDERIVLTYLSARRYDDAIAHYESTIDGHAGPLSPQLVVEMIRAYCEVDRLDRAAELIERLEALPVAEEPMLAFFVNRARLVFLAFLGRTGAVEAMTGASGPLAMLPEASRYFWSGVARLNAGDRSGARSSLEAAMRRAGRDRRARELAERTLASIDEPGMAGPRAVPPPVAELADRVAGRAAKARPPAQREEVRISGVGARAIPVTAVLVATNLAAAAVLYLMSGSTGDLGELVRVGANVKSAVAVGEWWRLPASTFLHVGLLHLLLNMYGLWILGKLVEQMFGPVRFFGLYAMAGLGGAVASFAFGGPTTSVGASGAVFGLLGALLVELGIRRKAYPERWRRALFGNLVFLTLANVGIGFAYPSIDQSAHLGGLVTGAVVALVLSRKSSYGASAAVRGVAVALALIGVGSMAYAAYGVASNDYADTLARYDRAIREVGGLRVVVPAHWAARGTAEQRMEPSFELGIALERLPAVELERAIEGITRQTRSEMSRIGARVDAAPHRTVAVPEPWRSRELLIQVDSMGAAQRYREVAFARRAGDEVWRGSFVYPAALADDVGPLLRDILESAEPVGPLAR